MNGDNRNISIEDFKMGKLYEVWINNGQHTIIFRDEKGLRSNAQENGKPLRRYDVSEIIKHQLYEEGCKNG